MKSDMEKPIKAPTHPCYNCGSFDYWKRTSDGAYICKRCHPPVIKPLDSDKHP